MVNNILEVSQLSKSYDGQKLVLSNCNFQLERGKICAIVGESGSGKSTLFRLIAGLERPDDGQIKIDEKIVSNDRIILAPQKRKVGFVFQNYALFPHLTVAQNIAFGLKKDKEKTVLRLLKLIKMEGYGKVYPSELSGGQEQRVAIARTLALTPSLLLLDEPFSNLDASLKSGLRQEIKLIVKKVGTSMMFITHDIIDALDIADELLLLKEGNIVEYTSITNLSQTIQNGELKKLLTELKHNTTRILNFLE